MQYELITNLTDLSRIAPEWDALVDRSEERQPTRKVATLLNFIGRFEKPDDFVAVVVRDEDRQLIAALPLVIRRLGILRFAAMPNNPWLTCGELLIDPRVDSAHVSRQLVLGLQGAGVDLIWFDRIEIESERWRTLCRQLEQLGQHSRTRRQFHVGMIDIDGDFDSYIARVSKGHRKKMRSRLKKLRAKGDLSFEYQSAFDGQSIDTSLAEFFTLEDKGWKGESSSSVLANPGLFEFYQREAIILRDLKSLRLCRLKLDGRLIAFEYGYLNKRVYHSLKVGYDQVLSPFSPGQLLTHELLRHFHESGEVDAFDTLGELSGATQKWITRSWLQGRVRASLNTRGSLFLLGHGFARRLAAIVRGKSEGLADPKLIRPASDSVALKRAADRQSQIDDPVDDEPGAGADAGDRCLETAEVVYRIVRWGKGQCRRRRCAGFGDKSGVFGGHVGNLRKLPSPASGGRITIRVASRTGAPSWAQRAATRTKCLQRG